MTKKRPPKFENKIAKLLDDRIVLSNSEILFSDIKKFDVYSNDDFMFYVFIGLGFIAIASEFITDFQNNTYSILYIIFVVAWLLSLSFGIPEDLSKKYLQFFLKDGTIETIHPSGFKSLIAQLQVVWENHDINKLKQLNNWANKEIETLNKSLIESKKENKEKDFPIDLILTKWDNQYIHQALELRSIFNVK